MHRSFLLFLFLLSYAAFAQEPVSLKAIKDIKITVGKPYRLIKGQPRDYYYDGKYTIALKTTDRRKVTLQCFDTRTNTEVSRVDYTDLPEHEIQPALEFNDHFYYLYSVYNKLEKKTTALCT
jgi:hypothetical protein